MKIAFVSNSFNHHQKPLSDALYRVLGDDYCFIETRPIRQERLNMGWGQENKPAYVKRNYGDSLQAAECQRLIDQADVVIHGSAPHQLIKNRIRQQQLVLIYSERIYKRGVPYIKLPWHFILHLRKGYGKRNVHLLCASAYTAADFARSFTFLNKTYKWGYFPEIKLYDLDGLIAHKGQKEKLSILWVGRFLTWKHPEVPVLIAARLKQDGYDFDLNIIGSGEMDETLRSMVVENALEKHVHFPGTMRPEQVREHMEAADIYLFTSDFNEGWGAVLNESMNSACAVVASHAMGSAPFLIKDGENGFMYPNGDLDAAYSRVVQLIEQPQKREAMARNAYQTIAGQWNAETAAERLLALAQELLSGSKRKLYEDGPCSRARLLRNGWYGARKP